jgi:uncharacterized tellurite resistance protein B-like protein
MDPMSKMRLIVGAAMADGKLQDAEQPVVLRCAERLGLAVEDVQGLAVVRADGTIDSDELAFVHAIGELFGFSEETIEGRLGG